MNEFEEKWGFKPSPPPEGVDPGTWIAGFDAGYQEGFFDALDVT